MGSPSKPYNVGLTPPQLSFLALPCKFPAFVGGFGSGKTEVLSISALNDSKKGGANSLVALYEPTYDLVRLILAPRIEEKLIDWGVRYKYNKSENVVYTSNTEIGDFIFRTLDNPARIIGYESFRSHIDEIDTLKIDKANEAWNKIIARNRQKPKTANTGLNRVSVYTTPEGFNFVYKKWKKNPTKSYMMVNASTQSNPFLPEDYIDSLRETYPDNLVEAYINGNFVNLTSGTVYHQFNRILNASNEVIKPFEPLLIGMDFNVQKMSAVVHVKRKNKMVTELHAVDEIMGAYDTPDMIEQILLRHPDRQIIVYPDSSGKNRKSVGASDTDITLLRDAGFKVLAPNKNPPVRSRINSVNAMICNGDNIRRYFVNILTCPLTADSLEQQVYNLKGEPDKAHDTDHPNDAVGYVIHYEFPIIKKIATAW